MSLDDKDQDNKKSISHEFSRNDDDILPSGAEGVEGSAGIEGPSIVLPPAAEGLEGPSIALPPAAEGPEGQDGMVGQDFNLEGQDGVVFGPDGVLGPAGKVDRREDGIKGPNGKIDFKP